MTPPFDPDRRAARALVVAFVLLLAWDLSGLDMALARLAGGAQGFALRDDWLFSNVLHDGMRRLGWAAVVALCVGIVWPVGPLVGLPFGRRLQLPASALLATGAVVLLKAGNHTSCPWDLADFGGVARHVSHWAGWWGATDGGAGRCFPAGHASTGFAFVGGWFALKDSRPRLARAWLATALVSGLLLGLVQQWRGAHFMSHTLWSAWLCAAVAWLSDPLFARLRAPAVVEVAR